MLPHRNNAETRPNDEYVTAVEMAEAANINPKAFRRALRKKHLSWHDHNARRTVLRGSKEHQAMEQVLAGLTIKSRS